MLPTGWCQNHRYGCCLGLVFFSFLCSLCAAANRIRAFAQQRSAAMLLVSSPTALLHMPPHAHANDNNRHTLSHTSTMRNGDSNDGRRGCGSVALVPPSPSLRIHKTPPSPSSEPQSKVRKLHSLQQVHTQLTIRHVETAKTMTQPIESEQSAAAAASPSAPAAPSAVASAVPLHLQPCGRCGSDLQPKQINLLQQLYMCSDQQVRGSDTLAIHPHTPLCLCSRCPPPGPYDPSAFLSPPSHLRLQSLCCCSAPAAARLPLAALAARHPLPATRCPLLRCRSAAAGDLNHAARRRHHSSYPAAALICRVPKIQLGYCKQVGQSSSGSLEVCTVCAIETVREALRPTAADHSVPCTHWPLLSTRTRIPRAATSSLLLPLSHCLCTSHDAHSTRPSLGRRGSAHGSATALLCAASSLSPIAA